MNADKSNPNAESVNTDFSDFLGECGLSIDAASLG